MADELTYAWAAGFLDGEGTFGLYAPSGKITNVVTRQPVAQAYQTQAAPLLRLAFVFGGTVRNTGKTKIGTPIHLWRITGSKAIVECIDKLYPYLTIKQPEAEIVRDYCKLMGRGTKLDEEQIEKRTILINRFTELRAA